MSRRVSSGGFQGVSNEPLSWHGDASLLELMQENGWMTAGEAAALGPRIRVELQDLRQDRSEALPVP
jgi:hypothetical protein